MIEPVRGESTVDKVIHGAIDYSEMSRLGLVADEVIDFSVNTNAFGPASGVAEALNPSLISSYPDRECLALRQEIADHHSVGMEHTLVGNGTSELIQLIADAYLTQGRTALVIEPTYSEYARAAQIAGGSVVTLGWDSLRRYLQQNRDLTVTNLLRDVDVVFLCNPNNPTGQHIEPTSIFTSLVSEYPDVLFVIDEAYGEFLLQPTSAICTEAENLIVLRSMTKDYALAGLRLGYAVAHESVIESLTAIRPAWNVNAFAQAAGIQSLRSHTWLRECVERLHGNKGRFVTALNEQGWTALNSHTHYFLLHVTNAATVRSALLQDGLLVRDCTSYGMPEFVRICTRLEPDNRRLLESLQRLRNRTTTVTVESGSTA